MLNSFYAIRPQIFFLTLAIGFFFSYSLLTPPFQTPDEYNHFYRSYTISQGDFLPQQQDKRLGGMVPVSFQDFITPFNSSNAQSKSKISRTDILRSFSVTCDEERLEFKDFPNTCYYSPISYLPQAFVLYLCSKLNVSVGLMYYAGRSFAFILWMLMMFQCIKMIPIGKWVLVFINLLPMQLYISNSFSADTITNILSFIWISLILKISFSAKRLDLKITLLLILIASLLALAKVIYVVLVLMILILPQNKFKNKTCRFVTIGLIMLLPILLAKWWSGHVTHNLLSYETYNQNAKGFATLLEGADYFAQKNNLLQQPLLVLEIFYNSMTLNPLFYLTGYVGYFGTFMDSPLPPMLCIIALIGLLVVVVFDRNSLLLKLKQKIFLALLFIILLFTLVITLYLTWCKVGCSGLEQLQGRYLIPIVPLILIALAGSSYKHKYNLAPFIFLIVTLLNVYAAILLYDRYFEETFKSKTEFFLDFESKDLTKGHADSASLSIMNEHTANSIMLSGSKSLAVKNSESDLIIFKFNKIKEGDWFLFECMRRGDKGRLQIIGIKKQLEVFNWIEECPRYSDAKGWDKLKMVRLADKTVDSVQILVKAINLGETPVYFDNVNFVYKTY